MKINGFPNSNSPLTKLLEHRAATDPGATAWLDADGGKSTSWRQWRDKIQAMSAQLIDDGIGSGSVVASVGTNDSAIWTLAFAAWRLGADFWPLNFRWTGPEFARAFHRLPRPPGLIVYESCFGEPLQSGLEQCNLDVLLRRRSRFTEQAEQKTEFFDYASRSGQLIMATGGTTGTPKLVGLDGEQRATSARLFSRMTDLDAGDRVMICAPNFHVAGFCALTTAAIDVGASLVAVPTFEPSALPDIIDDCNITATVMVPTMWRALFAALRDQSRDLSTMRFGICGGAPMDPALIDDARHLGLELLQGYGMTEAGPMVTLMPPGTITDKEDRRRSAAGIAPPEIEVRIVDDQYQPLPSNTGGQIAVCGPNIVDHYLSGDHQDSFVDQFLLTGDLGTIDDDGYLYVHGRLDDVIISGGENISPVEVETLLSSDPAIERAVVFGIADPHWGQRVVAMATRAGPTEGKTSKDGATAIVERARSCLAGYKLPRELRFVDEFPLTPAGKVSRHELRKLWLDSEASSAPTS